MSRAELLDRVFSRLVALNCDPRLSPDGNTITATCPCCQVPNAFEMRLPRAEPERVQ